MAAAPPPSTPHSTLSNQVLAESKLRILKYIYSNEEINSSSPTETMERHTAYHANFISMMLLLFWRKFPFLKHPLKTAYRSNWSQAAPYFIFYSHVCIIRFLDLIIHLGRHYNGMGFLSVHQSRDKVVPDQGTRSIQKRIMFHTYSGDIWSYSYLKPFRLLVTQGRGWEGYLIYRKGNKGNIIKCLLNRF